MNIDIDRTRRLYFSALGFIALSLILSSAIMQLAISLHSRDARRINLSGRQRMLSQNISKIVLSMTRTGPSERRGLTRELDQALGDLKAAHRALQFGDERLGVMPAELTEDLTGHFMETAPHFERIVDAAEALLKNAGQDSALLERSVRIILGNELPFLEKMEEITLHFETEAQDRIAQIRLIEYLILFAGLVILCLEYLFIFRPSMARLSESFLKVNAAREAAENANASKVRFFSILAHDLKNMFTGILGMSELLKAKGMEVKRENHLKFISAIHSQAASAFELLSNLLGWAQLQARNVVFEPSEFEASAMVEKTVEIVAESAGQKEIGISCRIPEGLTVHADRHMTDTVMRNLLSNSIKYSNLGGAVSVSAAIDGAMVVFSVKDDGAGMSREAAGRLFSGERIRPTRGTADEIGTGLGLMLCRELVEMNGGRIWVESSPGRGARFSFSLPRVSMKDREDSPVEHLQSP